jgi:hypothetical protein
VDKRMLEKEEITEIGCEGVEWIHRDRGFGEYSNKLLVT